MNPRPAIWTCRRPLFSTVAVICAVATLLTYGLPATPVKAATTSSASYGGPYTITYPGGDMVVSATDDGESTSMMQDWANTEWPEAVGLSPGASLSDLFQATWKWANNNVKPGFIPQPPTFSGGSISVSGSTITIDIPASDVSANNTPKWLASVAGIVMGGLTAMLAGGLCTIAFLGLTPSPGAALSATLGLPTCRGLSIAGFVFMSMVTYDGLTETPFTSGEWARILGATLAGFFVGFAITWAAPAFQKILSRILLKLWDGIKGAASKLWNIIDWLGNWIGGNQWTNFKNWMSNLLGRVNTDAPIQMTPIGQRAGQASQTGAGTVTTTGNCMDAYGSSGDAYPGQIVTINTCNGNPAQHWTDWSNNELTVWGLCMDTNGGTASDGGKLVDLEECRGSSTQAWKQNGATLVNQATGDCLDDPYGHSR